MAGLNLVLITAAIIVAAFVVPVIDHCISRAIPMKACAVIAADIIVNQAANRSSYEQVIEHYRP